MTEEQIKERIEILKLDRDGSYDAYYRKEIERKIQLLRDILDAMYGY